MLAPEVAGSELGPERPLRSSAIGQTRDLGDASVASDGSDYLVVWSGVGVRAARVSRSGELLDPLGFSVAPTQCSDGFFIVTGGARSYLVSKPCGPDGGTDAALVSPTGSVRKIHLSDGALHAVVWTGSLYLLVADDRRMASYLDENGEPVGQPFELAPSGFITTHVVAEAGRVVALLAPTPDGSYDPTSGLWITTIVDGHVTEAIPLEGWDVGPDGAPSFDGERLLLRYMVAGVFDRARIYGLDGRIIRDDFELPLSAERNIADIVWQGEFHIVRYARYTSHDQTLMTRLDREGNPIDQSPIPTVYGQWARSGEGFLAVTTQPDQTGVIRRGLYGTLLDLGGSPVARGSAPQSPLAFCRLRQDSAVRAWNGHEFMTAWREQTDSPTGHVVRVAGSYPGTSDVSIPVRASTNSGIPSIASNPQTTLVVWLDAEPTIGTQRVLAARFSPREGMLDAEPIELSTSAWFAEQPEVVWDGKQFIVAWGEGDLYAGEKVRLVASRVTAEGLLLDPEPVRLGDGSRSQMRPALAMNGELVTIAWEEADARIARAQISFQHRDVMVRSLDTRSGILAYPPVRVASAAPDGSKEPTDPSIACDTFGCLALYVEGGIPNANVRSAFIDSMLLALGGDVEGSDFLRENSESPVVVWDGRAFVASWTRRAGDDYDVVMRQFEPDGRPAARGEVSVAHSVEIERSPSLATRGDGNVVVLYERTAPEPAFGGTVQIFLRQELQRRRASRR